MIYLHVFAEGKTELTFTKRILQPFLGYEYYRIDPIQFTTGEDREGRLCKGGFGLGSGSYKRVKRQINNQINRFGKKGLRDEIHFFTTMFDLYALPNTFPGYDDAQKIPDPYQKVKKLEGSLAGDINDYRFIPYIQLHEFEAMIFVDSSQLIHQYPASEDKIALLKNVLNEKNVKNNPELINEGKTTAPSKRIFQYFPSYLKSKPIVGVNTVEKIGVDAIRSKCPHFHEWLCQLENLKSNLPQQ